MTADDHRAAEAVRQTAREINLFREHTVAVRFQMNGATTDAECAAVHVFAIRHRRKILRRTFRNVRVAPQKLARLRINSDESLAQKLYVLFATRSLHDDRRRVTRRIAARHRRSPNHRTSLFVERGQGGLWTTGSYYNYAAINQRRLCVRPLTRFSAKLLSQIFRPADFAGLRFQTREIAVGTECVKQVAIDCRGRARLRIRRVLIGIADFADARGP